MMRLQAKLWPKAKMRPKAMMQPKVMLWPKADDWVVDGFAIILNYSFSFSLTKYSAIFAEVKESFGIIELDNQLGRFGRAVDNWIDSQLAAEIVLSCMRSLRFWQVESSLRMGDQNELNNKLRGEWHFAFDYVET